MKTQTLYILGSIVVVGGAIYFLTRPRRATMPATSPLADKGVLQIRPTMLPPETPVKDSLNAGDPGSKDMFVGFVRRTQARFK